jgi:thymidylate synthase (FAD)
MKPSIVLIARPAFDLEAVLGWLEGMGLGWRRTEGATSAEELVEVAGRVCYMSFGELQSPKTTSSYIRNLVDQGHESVLEHVNWTFIISSVSRAFTHQLVRHRPGFAYSQLSQQYHDERGAEFVKPTHLDRVPKALKAWEKSIQASRDAYGEIMSALSDQRATGTMPAKEIRRAIQSAARSVLPNATETKIIVTANARALRHFLTVRGAILGDEEMRFVSSELLSLLSNDAPALFSDFRSVIYEDGLPIVERMPQA